MLKKLFLIILIFVSFSVSSFAQEIDISEVKYLQGEVVGVLEEKEILFEGLDEKQQYQRLEILITKGSIKGETIDVEIGGFAIAQVNTYEVGDRVYISYSKDLEGNDVFYITDYIRTGGLLILFIIFAIAAVIVGSKKGVLSLFGMLVTFFIIFLFILPQIQIGKDPVLIVVLASIFMIPVTFYFSHGFKKKVSVAVVGTFISLIITGLLAYVFVDLGNLNGVVSEEALLLQTVGDSTYNLKGLLLAGIIIGALGVLDDITVSQSAIVFQIYELDNRLKFKELYRKAMQLGKDHIASMINTLILVYTGASLPLLLLFMDGSRTFSGILSLEIISTEIIRTLVGSLGLIVSVPITTFIAVYVVMNNRNGKVQRSIV